FTDGPIVPRTIERRVSYGAHALGTGSSGCALKDVPAMVEGTPDRQIGFPIAVVISRRRNIIVGRKGRAPVDDHRLIIAALVNPPAPIASPYCQIGLAVIIEISRTGAVSCGRRSPGLRTDGIIRAIDNVPESVERPPDRQIGFPIAIVIRWRGN